MDNENTYYLFHLNVFLSLVRFDYRDRFQVLVNQTSAKNEFE